jgi:hypothetical protein
VLTYYSISIYKHPSLEASGLCAHFELSSQGYAKDVETWEGMAIDERREAVCGNLMEACKAGPLRNVYRRLARRPGGIAPSRYAKLCESMATRVAFGFGDRSDGRRGIRKTDT